MSSWPPLSSLTRKEILGTGVLAAAYIVGGKLGLQLASVHPSATAVWPPTGIALAGLLLLGIRVWPVIFISAFLVNVTTAGTMATCLSIAAGNTLEAVVGAWLVNRFASGRRAFNRTPNIFRFALFGGLAGTSVSATIGVTSIILGGLALRADFSSIWSTWWLGDAAGALVVAPAILLWAQNPRLTWTRIQALECVALLTCLLGAAQVVFGGFQPSNSTHSPVDFFLIPIFVWGAFRFGKRGAAIAILLVSAVAIRGTLHGHGPFATPNVNQSLMLLQAFMAVTALTSQILAAEVAERRTVEERLRQLARTDPLTGLANYRRLTDVLEAEIRRTGRSRRSFAVLFFDLDGLKEVNDRHGHLVGSRALIRMAEAIQRSCRALDTAARYGGDEFAVVLPEASEEAAHQVVRRICDRLAADGQRPSITASVGVALYPRDGRTKEALLGAADRLLYQAKADGLRSPAPPARRIARSRRA